VRPVARDRPVRSEVHEPPIGDRRFVCFVLAAGHTGYAAAAVVLAWMTSRRPSDLLRIPVWPPFIAIIVLCWLNT